MTELLTGKNIDEAIKIKNKEDIKLIEKKVKFRWDKVIKNSSFVLNEYLINFENEFLKDGN